MATIYDVAKLAGVSPATVSRVLNGIAVSEAKAAAVRSAAEELEFVPNRTARGLRTQTSEVIGLIIPDVENPYFTQVARGVEDAAQKAGYSVVLCNSDADPEKERVYLRIAVLQNMAGVIIAAASEDTDIGVVTAAGRPVVAIDRHNAFPVDTVVIDNRDAGYSATIGLIEQGFRRIACVSGPLHIDTARERAQGWRDAMQERLGATPGDLLVESNFQVGGGRAAMLQLLDRPERPDAVLLGNNLLGVGAIQVLSEKGLTPPAIGVAVLGSLPFTTIAPSAVSVMHLPGRKMGGVAADLLIDRLRGNQEPPRAVVLPGRLTPADLAG